jgi:3-hydroxyisobutyrate dehydrogenase
VTATVVVIGVGRMGLAICGRLVQAGFDVAAHDVRSDREAPVRSAGARWAADPGEAVAGAEVVITVLPGSRELGDAATALVSRLEAGSTWIDMTSASPLAARAWTIRAGARGAQCLDAPVGGGVSDAQAGSLQIFVGGPADVVERQRPILSKLGAVAHMGENGAGYTTKLLVNLLWFGQAVVTGEALLLARQSGIDLETLRATLSDSAAGSDFIRHDVPALLKGDYLASYGLDRCLDQLDAVAALADQHGVPRDVTGAVRDVFQAAVERFGAVDGELLAVALLEERAGVRLAAERRRGD